MSQQWQAPFTPRQRWIFLQLALHDSAPPITTSAEGKAFRRALRALGITAIRDAMGTGLKVADKMAECTTPALFTLTAENVDAALRWATVPRHPSLEMDGGGDAFDLLEQLRDNSTAWKTPDGVPAYDPALEDWRPQPNRHEADEASALDLVALIVNDPNRPSDPDKRPVACWTADDWRRAQVLVAKRP